MRLRESESSESSLNPTFTTVERNLLYGGLLMVVGDVGILMVLTMIPSIFERKGRDSHQFKGLQKVVASNLKMSKVRKEQEISCRDNC